MRTCVLGLGANLGEREATFRQVLEALSRRPELSAVRSSPWYRTAPVGGPAGQDWFLNAAIALETDLPATELLRLLRELETSLGRTRDMPWCARTIDLDLLLCGSEIIDLPELVVPHPRLAYRRFVLTPAADVAGELPHPELRRTLAELRDDLDRPTRVAAWAAIDDDAWLPHRAKLEEAVPGAEFTTWRPRAHPAEPRPRLIVVPPPEWEADLDPLLVASRDRFVRHDADSAVLWLGRGKEPLPPVEEWRAAWQGIDGAVCIHHAAPTEKDQPAMTLPKSVMPEGPKSANIDTPNSPNADASNSPNAVLPKLVKTVAELRAAVAAARRSGRMIGCVPTMGALHAGHASLAAASKAAGDYTVATIFVNPTQFGPNEDFGRYPRQLAADLELLGKCGTDLVFAPAVEEMYPRRAVAYIDVDEVTSRWEGPLRPGHFRGVATVVAKLFHMTLPDRAYFGQKDFQQTVVIRRMIEDLDFPVELIVRPTCREPDGLAMSSRNVYLSPADRAAAATLSRALRLGETRFRAGERQAAALLAAMRAVLEEVPAVRTEYLAVADARTLEPLDLVPPGAVVLLAARVGTTRLIDNLLLSE